jgi:hypothetical protein
LAWYAFGHMVAVLALPGTMLFLQAQQRLLECQGTFLAFDWRLCGGTPYRPRRFRAPFSGLPRHGECAHMRPAGGKRIHTVVQHPVDEQVLLLRTRLRISVLLQHEGPP